jgi:AAA ATPase domain
MDQQRTISQIRVFLSSPGDVAYERGLARDLLKDELPFDPLLLRGFAFDVVSWDDPAAPIPMDARITPQQAVNRFGPKPSECDVVIVILWARMGTHLDVTTFRKPDSSPYLSGTEWEFEDAVNAAEAPIIFIYRRTEDFKVAANDPMREEKFKQFDLVDGFFKLFRNPDGSYLRSFTLYSTPTEFKDRLRSDIKQVLKERLLSSRPDTYSDALTHVASTWSGSPYPGLRPFTSEEGPIFFGRGREVDALIALMRETRRFLAVVGSSGSGKSSLVRAGLLPRLMDGAIDGSQHWPVLISTPGASGDNPLLAFASELKGMLPASAQRPQIEIATALGTEPARLSDYTSALLADSPPDATLVLFIDQFEELFTLAADEHRRRFLDFLAWVTNAPRMCVLVTLRADFLPQCAKEPILAALLQTGTFVLGPPGQAALTDMIRRPAERSGLELEDGLADEILKDAGSDPGEALPLVAFCLEELYQRTAPARSLTLVNYHALGGLRGAIGQRAHSLLDELRHTDREALNTALSHVFECVVQFSASGKASRRKAPRDEFMAAPKPTPQLVEKLIFPGRLLLAENTGGRATVTLAHEALLQEWPDLRNWLGLDYLALLRKGVVSWNSWRV